MKNLDTYKERMLNENFTKGDIVKLKYDIEEDETDGHYSYSIDAGEIGEIRYLVKSTENESDENKVYMVKFPDQKGRKRYVQLTQQSFKKISNSE